MQGQTHLCTLLIVVLNQPLGSATGQYALAQGVAALHDDDDFQSDLRQPHVRAAIDKIREKPELMAA